LFWLAARLQPLKRGTRLSPPISNPTMDLGEGNRSAFATQLSIVTGNNIFMANPPPALYQIFIETDIDKFIAVLVMIGQKEWAC